MPKPKQCRIPVYFTESQMADLREYQELTTEDPLSCLIRKAILEKVHAFQERQALLRAGGAA